MKTLTITEAKKNLSRWLAAAAQGQDVGIVCGADIIALRKIEVESTVTRNASTPQPGSKLKRWTERRTKDTANSSGQENSLR